MSTQSGAWHARNWENDGDVPGLGHESPERVPSVWDALEGGDPRRTILDPVDRLDHGYSSQEVEDDDEAPTETRDVDPFANIFAGLGPQEPAAPRARDEALAEAPAAHAVAAAPEPEPVPVAVPVAGVSEARRARQHESVWDAVEARYRTEGHWNDLVDMYLQRAEGTRDFHVKRSLFCRIGQVMRDQLGDPQQALDAFMEAVILEPADQEALAGVEGLARQHGWWAQVLATLKRELPNVGEAERAVALCEHGMRWARDEMGAPGRGEAFLDRIRKLDPTHPAIHKRLASLYREHGEWGAQREELDRALLTTRAASERLALHLALAELNEDRFGDMAQATAHFDAALRLDPRCTRALVGLERIFRAGDRFAELARVLELMAEAAETTEDRVGVLLRLAEVNEACFVRPQQAVTSLEEVLRLDPGNGGALDALERCYRSMRAWSDVARVVELRARQAPSAKARAALLLQVAEILDHAVGDARGASEVWREIWDLDPANEQALAELARLSERAEDWTASAAYRAKLADLAPSPEAASRMHVAIGDMLAESDRDLVLSRVHYEKASSLHPANTQAWEALERDARRRGDIRRAALFLEKRAASTENARDKAQLFVELAAIQRDAGDEPNAQLACERALKADPTNLAAAEAALEAHVREGRWPEAQPLCGMLLDAALNDGERTIALLRLAARIASELGQRGRALAACAETFRLLPTLESAEDLVDAGFAAREEEAALAGCEPHLQAVVTSSLELSPPLLAKLARVRQAQGAESDAMALFSKALAGDPQQCDALAGLAEISAARGDWERAGALRQKQAHAVSDAEERFALLVEAGEIWAHRAKNMAMAALVLEEALSLKPRDHGVLHSLMWLYGELGSWERLVLTLRAVAELHADRAAKAKSLYALAMVVRDRIGDRRRAAGHLEEVLDLDPSRLDAFERLVRVHTELRDWVELKHAYGRMLRRLRTEGSVELRHALLFQLGLIYRDRLGDAARALDAFRAAQRLRPDAENVRKGMVELFVVTDQLDEGVSMVRAALAKRPLEAGLYGELYELFLRKHAFDRAWCALDALATLGVPLDAQRTRFYADYPPPALANVPGTLAAAAWRSHVLHAGLDPALTAIFALVTPSLLRARTAIIPFQQLRESLGEPLRMNGSLAQEVLCTVTDASEILAIPPPSLHASTQHGVPFALAPAKNALFVSLGACEALPADALAFVVGKRLSELRPELAARAACPSVTELKGLVRIAVQLAEPTLVAPSTGNSAFDRALAQAITREERAALRAALAAAKAQGSELDVARWSKLADISAARVGLLLAGRLDAAKRGMLAERQMPGDLSSKDKLAELTLFSVSEEYADLRQAIGVGVEATAAA